MEETTEKDGSGNNLSRSDSTLAAEAVMAMLQTAGEAEAEGETGEISRPRLRKSASSEIRHLTGSLEDVALAEGALASSVKVKIGFLVPRVSQFVKSYQRNNKKGGIKNIRCFPICVQDIDGGSPWCGSICREPLKISIKGAFTGLPYIFGRFKCIDEPELADVDFTSSTFVPGRIYHDLAARVRTYIRTKERPLGHFFEASITSHVDLRVPPGMRKPATIIAEFRERGWHYGWQGGRYKKGYRHCFEILVFEKLAGTENFRCVSARESPTFTVFSSRRSSPLDRVLRRKRKGERSQLSESRPSSKSRRGSATSWSSSSASGSNRSILIASAGASTSARGMLAAGPGSSASTSTRSLPVLQETDPALSSFFVAGSAASGKAAPAAAASMSSTAADAPNGSTKPKAPADFNFFLSKLKSAKDGKKDDTMLNFSAS